MEGAKATIISVHSAGDCSNDEPDENGITFYRFFWWGEKEGVELCARISSEKLQFVYCVAVASLTCVKIYACHSESIFPGIFLYHTRLLHYILT